MISGYYNKRPPFGIELWIGHFRSILHSTIGHHAYRAMQRGKRCTLKKGDEDTPLRDWPHDA